MQVIWCVTFCNMTKSGGGQSPPLQILGGLVSPSPVIYAHALREACGVAGCDFKFLLLLWHSPEPVFSHQDHTLYFTTCIIILFLPSALWPSRCLIFRRRGRPPTAKNSQQPPSSATQDCLHRLQYKLNIIVHVHCK